MFNSRKTNFEQKNIPILHPGPVNRGIEISSRIVDEYANCLINQQVSNGIPVRMALLYLLSKYNKKVKAIKTFGKSHRTIPSALNQLTKNIFLFFESEDLF